MTSLSNMTEIDEVTYWNVEAVEFILDKLSQRDKPLTPEACHKLAKVLDKIIAQHDEKLIRSTLKAKPEDKTAYLWEFKRIVHVKGRYFFWVPIYSKDDVKVVAVKDDSYMVINNIQKDYVKKIEKDGKVFYSFEWLPNTMNMVVKAGIKRLKSANRYYFYLQNKTNKLNEII